MTQVNAQNTAALGAPDTGTQAHDSNIDTQTFSGILQTAGGRAGLLTVAWAIISAIVMITMTPGYAANVFMTLSIMLICVGGIVTIGLLSLEDAPWGIYLILSLPVLAQLYFVYMLTYHGVGV